MIKYIFWALALISIDVYSQKNSFEITEVANNSNELKSKVNDVHLKKFQWLADKQIDSLLPYCMMTYFISIPTVGKNPNRK